MKPYASNSSDMLKSCFGPDVIEDFQIFKINFRSILFFQVNLNQLRQDITYNHGHNILRLFDV